MNEAWPPIPTPLGVSLTGSTTLEWLIIGGGIHGVHIAVRLLGESGVSPKHLQIVDPGTRLLERWRKCTDITGMSHLRSPSVHHLDLNPWALRKLAGKRSRTKAGIFAHPYDRPSLDFFNAHCDQVIGAYELADLHVQARAMSAEVDCDGVRVKLSNGQEISTQNLVLAVGSSDQPAWPDWAPRNTHRVHHIFDPKFDGWPSHNETVAVVGGGISAAQVALRLRDEGNEVHLISRHPRRKHQFDSAPGWLGPKLMRGFRRERDVDRRRDIIADARYRGSVPPDVERKIRAAIARDEIYWHQTAVDSLDIGSDQVSIRLANGGSLETQRVLLATGFSSKRPGGALVDRLVESASLPCANCGYPITDPSLRWHPRVHVTGPLAELELGPSSRNIAGARRAGERILEAARISKNLKSVHASTRS